MFEACMEKMVSTYIWHKANTYSMHIIGVSGEKRRWRSNIWRHNKWEVSKNWDVSKYEDPLTVIHIYAYMHTYKYIHTFIYMKCIWNKKKENRFYNKCRAKIYDSKNTKVGRAIIRNIFAKKMYFATVFLKTTF